MLGIGLKAVLGSTHVVEQFLFCMFSSILTFTFNLIIGSFFPFLGPNGLFFGLGKGSYTGLGSTHGCCDFCPSEDCPSGFLSK